MLIITNNSMSCRNSTQTLNSGGYRNSWGQNTVSKKSCATNHGRNNQPFGALFNQTVERKDSALIVVVCLHCNHDVFNGCNECQRPDNEGQSTQNNIGAHGKKSTITSDNCLHGVHWRSANVTVDDAKGNKYHAST